MSGLVSTAPAPSGEATIHGDGWWPDVDMAAARDALRLDGTVTDPRLHAALVAGILATSDDLTDWRTAQETAGYATLADVPAKQVDGTSRYVSLYLRAVYCTAHADLIERYRNFDTIDATGATPRGGEQRGDMIDDQRRNARWAIRDILGVGRSTVELI